MARQYDSYGNYTDDDGATWVGVGPNAGQYYYGGSWHDFPPISSGSSSNPNRYQIVTSDGSDGLPPGTRYQLDTSDGSKSNFVYPKSGSSGGGGSSSPTNVYINQNPGELYQTIVSDGSDGYPAGTVYQVNQLTGAVTVKSRPPSSAGVNPADKNNDGLDDTTNMALGVYKYAGSPTGYAYGNGQPVWPNGAPYEGGTTGGSDLDLSNKISKGGVTYVWSNKEQKYVPAPGLPLSSGPGSTPTSGGTYSASGSSSARAILSSGGGGSTAASRDYAAEAEQQGQTQERLIRLQNALKNDPNNPYLIMEQQQLALQAQQIANSQRNADAQLRRQNILDFESAVSDTDMAKLNARRLALGANGDVSIANLLRDTPDGFQANDAAAALLAEIRGQGQMTPVGGVAGAFGISGASGGTTGTTPTGAATATGTAPGTTTATGTQQTTIGGPIDPYLYDPTTGQRLGMNPAYIVEQGNLRQQEARAAAAAEDRITFDPKNYVALDAFHFKNTVSGKVYNLAEYTNILQQANGDTAGQMSEADQMATAIQNAQARAQMTSQIQGTPYTDPFANRTSAIGTYGTTLYNTPQGWTLTNQQASTKPQSGAESFIPGAMPYGNDQIQRGIDLPNKVITPMARGGVAYGAMVTGDSPSGRPTGHEELVIAPRGAMVIPMRRMAPVMRQQIMDRTQRFADGTFGIGDAGATQIADHTPLVASAGTLSQGWNPRRFVMQPVAQPISQPAPAAQPVTQPAAQQQPVAAQPAPVVTQPQQPAQNTMQPVQTQPTTAGGAPVTTTPAFDPANPVALTPEAIANLQEIRNFRDSQNNLAGIGLLDASFNRLAPTLRASALQQFQTRTGVPIQDVQFEQQRYALQGRGRAMLPVGY
jgi:hypothetical protein